MWMDGIGDDGIATRTDILWGVCDQHKRVGRGWTVGRGRGEDGGRGWTRVGRKEGATRDHLTPVPLSSFSPPLSSLFSSHHTLSYYALVGFTVLLASRTHAAPSLRHDPTILQSMPTPHSPNHKSSRQSRLSPSPTPVHPPDCFANTPLSTCRGRRAPRSRGNRSGLSFPRSRHAAHHERDCIYSLISFSLLDPNPGSSTTSTAHNPSSQIRGCTPSAVLVPVPIFPTVTGQVSQ